MNDSDVPTHRRRPAANQDRHQPTTTSRRSLLAGAVGGLVAGEAALASKAATAAEAAAAPFQTVTPISSNRVYHLFGINTQPNALKTAYGSTDAWLDSMKQTGATYFRGLYSPGLSATARVVKKSRSLGLKWGMQVAMDINADLNDVEARVRHIAANAADRCLFIEGVNEPNNVRGPNTVPPGWKAKTIRIQEVIYDTTRSDTRLDRAVVIGPSLRDVSATRQDYVDLRNMGLLDHMDFAGIHRYPNGNYPSFMMDEKVAMIHSVWPKKPIWISEHGYTNSPASTTGQQPAPEPVAAQYAPASILEAADRNLHLTWYELLDEPDPGSKDSVEANFGMFATQNNRQGPPWRHKPVVDTVSTFLAQLRDPGPTYQPPAIQVKVTSNLSDVRHTLTGKRDGSVYVHLRRETNCWDPKTRRTIPVAKAQVKVSTPTTSVTAQVNHQVTTIQIV